MIEAEFASVGCMLLQPDRVVGHARGVMKLEPSDFSDPALRIIVMIIFKRVQNDEFVDALIVDADAKAAFPDHELSAGSGWMNLCISATDKVVTYSFYESYLDLVYGLAKTRKLESLLSSLAEKSSQPMEVENVKGFLADVLKQVSSACTTPVIEETNIQVMDRILVSWEDAKAFQGGDLSKKPATGLRMPWPELDSIFCGLEIGTFLFAGRPSAGKTTLEDMCAEQVCQDLPDETVLRWTMDSTHDQLLGRQMCRMSSLSFPKAKRGFSTHEQLERAREAKAAIARYKQKFYFGIDLHQGLSWIRSQVATRKVSLVTIDYVQQIALLSVRGFRADNENSRLQEISGSLKALSLELKIPFIVLSQLNRPHPADKGRTSSMQDLRGSGSLEQDASKVLFISVAEKKAEEMERREPDITNKKRPVKIEILKQKDGAKGWKPYWLLPNYYRLVGPAHSGFNSQKEFDPWLDDESL